MALGLLRPVWDGDLLPASLIDTHMQALVRLRILAGVGANHSLALQLGTRRSNAIDVAFCAPTIDAYSPNPLDADGSALTLTGSSFGPSSAPPPVVHVDDGLCDATERRSAFEIVCRSSRRRTGRANVSVAVGGQRSNFKGVLVACVAEGREANAEGECEHVVAPTSSLLPLWVLLFVSALIIGVAVPSMRRSRQRQLAAESDLREGWSIRRDAIAIDADALLGRGGFGDVYTARYLGSRVACKVIRARAGAGEGAVDGFVTEVSLMTKLHHPNIVLIMGVSDDVAEDGERQICIVTELMANVSLSLRKKPSPAPPCAIR